MKEHTMYLLDADLSRVLARLARKKCNAGEVQRDESRIRKAEAVGSSPTTSPIFDASDFFLPGEGFGQP